MFARLFPKSWLFPSPRPQWLGVPPWQCANFGILTLVESKLKGIDLLFHLADSHTTSYYRSMESTNIFRQKNSVVPGQQMYSQCLGGFL